VIAPVLLLAQHRAVRAALLVLAVAATVAVNVAIANDLSRSASTVIPAAVLGIVLLVRARISLADWLVPAALAFNLLTPAWHVLATWDGAIRIAPVYYELNRLKHPSPQMVGPQLSRAAMFARRGRLRKSLAEVETAIRINPTSALANINRGVLLHDLGRPAEAAACYDAAVGLAPHHPDVFRERARFLLATGHLAAAEQDLRTAIDLAPAGSALRAAIQLELAQMQRALGKP
jgi:tetratricopeptide (TPR) repeat protein